MLVQGSAFSQTERTQAPRTIQLSQGQVVKGKIVKLFPNNLVALQLGRMTLTARLEAALSAGKDYFFQVQEESSGVPRLKVLSQQPFPVQGDQAGMIKELLQQLGLAQTKTNEWLASQLTGMRMPFTKGTIEAGAPILTTAGMLNEEGVRLLQGMLLRQLPITSETFSAYRALQEGPPLSSQLTELIQQLRAHPQLESYGARMEALMQDGKIPQGRSPVIELLSMVANDRLEPSVREGAVQLLNRLGIMNQGETRESFFSRFQQALMRPENREIVQQLWPTLTNEMVRELAPRELFQRLMAEGSIPPGEKGSQQLIALVQLLGSKVTPAMITSFLSGNGVNLSREEQLAWTTSFQLSSPQQQIGGTGTSSPIAAQLIRLLQALGLQYEREVGQSFQQGTDPLANDRMKGLLLQLMQQELSPKMKERLEAVLNRVTGHQLVASETSGPITQTAIQLPLMLGSFQTDLTIQWEGKRQADGQLSPDHCRILFYLSLAHLKETIVDVQIQHRILAVTIFNEHPKPTLLMSGLLPVLKSGLERQDYSLSSLVWKEIETEKKNAISWQSPEKIGYQGVDVRI
ncbi:hypothetical protein E2L07_09830 [Halalkalibacterium halodurans]|uniref:hypothetical protein n=1 Tax=Halalkalibacterium halodurans TaxID=86665 RepID=UPI001067642F|nr:hypothetical protein [Halalkalibacterium halodurans]TES54491.1 hypothetical protein E2L07_09830 [Halalkalibacterium halodurans]